MLCDPPDGIPSSLPKPLLVAYSWITAKYGGTAHSQPAAFINHIMTGVTRDFNRALARATVSWERALRTHMTSQ